MATPPNSTSVHEVTNDADFARFVSTFAPEALLVIYFHAPWAAPCQQMSVVLQILANTYSAVGSQKIGFLSVNAEELPDVSEQYEVTAVPYIVLQKGGKTIETVPGSDAAKVRDAVEKYAGSGAGATQSSSMPPVQAVTKPEQNVAAPQSNGSKNLSSYIPESRDPQTAPEYSSGETVQTSKEDLHARLQGLVKAAPVMLFMKGTPSAPQCGFSRQTVSLLRERGIRYGFFNILADDEVRQGLKEFGEWPTYPQLWVGGELVGGLDIVKEEFSNDSEFLNEYSVSSQKNTGGPAAPEAQSQPA